MILIGRSSAGWLWIGGLASLFIGCTDNDAPPDTDAKIAEGIFAKMGEPLPSATPEQLDIFERGREVALRRFSPEEGLGPKFNVSFCAGCHEKPVFGGSAGRYRNFLLVKQQLSDGSQAVTGVNGIQTQYDVEGSYSPTDPKTNLMATRNPIPFFGTGLLAEIPAESILANADPEDADGDGISGRPNYDRGFVGRFGRKSQTVSIEGFIRGPIFNHLGVTSDPLSNELKNALPVPSGVPEGGEVLGNGDANGQQAQAAAPDEPNSDDDGVPDPELSQDDLFAVVAFSMLLAAPMPDEPTEQTSRGAEQFQSVGCAACHTPTLAGPRGLLPLYSDLLLHDMGDELADGIVMGDSTGNEFRTQPLWGVGAVGPYLHDGRADTLDEAIRFHGGEADKARAAYEALSEEARGDIIAFLNSLGGADQHTSGLMAPDYVEPAVGDYGGPEQSLGAADMERFVRGRAAFDMDRSLSAGVGPRFNGDSCRACHFDPVIGGSGPQDVNVMRHGIVEGGVFTTPSIGTMAHHQAVGSERPPIDPNANVFELRQTPSLLGLGLIDRIPEETIIALADPDDLDGDGISGVAHILPDGRLGRLGWKANVPSLKEFARDAMFNEIGITLPEQEGLTFGDTQDDDDAADPEITKEELGDLVFFMQSLAAPPRTRSDKKLEDDGEGLFAAIGCDGCHVPALTTDDGVAAMLYSDLLLHDIGPPDFVGIETGLASMREFRTAPLWGLATSAPYMHDGSSYSIEDAIARHDAEAGTARAGYESLTASEREALLMFLSSL